MCVKDGKVLAVTMDNDIVYPTSKYDRDTGYDVPTDAVYTWKGKTVDGRDFACSASKILCWFDFIEACFSHTLLKKNFFFIFIIFQP